MWSKYQWNRYINIIIIMMLMVHAWMNRLYTFLMRVCVYIYVDVWYPSFVGYKSKYLRRKFPFFIRILKILFFVWLIVGCYKGDHLFRMLSCGLSKKHNKENGGGEITQREPRIILNVCKYEKWGIKHDKSHKLKKPWQTWNNMTKKKKVMKLDGLVIERIFGY
jgi:hypothetical protein